MAKNKGVITEFTVMSRFEPSRDQGRRLEKVYEIAFFSEEKFLKKEEVKLQENRLLQNNHED